MALQLSYTNDRTGDIYPEAYHRVDELSLVNKQSATILVNVYGDALRKASGKLPVDIRRTYILVSPDFDLYFATAVLDRPRSNPIKKSYEYLKTLPDYAGALDV